MELRVLHHHTSFWARAHAAPRSPLSAPSVGPPPTNPQEKGYTNVEFLIMKVPLSQADVVRLVQLLLKRYIVGGFEH